MLKGAIFIDAIFNQRQFSNEQKNEIIFTQRELEDYQAEQLRLIKESKRKIEKANERVEQKQVIIEQQEQQIEMKDEVINQTEAEQTKKLQHGFMELKEEFGLEERRWIVFSILSALLLSSFAIIPVLESFSVKGIGTIIGNIYLTVLFIIFSVIISWFIWEQNEKQDTNRWYHRAKDWIYEKAKAIFLYFALVAFVVNWVVAVWQIYFIATSQSKIDVIKSQSDLPEGNKSALLDHWKEFLPIEVLFFSLLYFCISQYVKAKNLRIEHQNKVAIIDGYQAFKAMLGDDRDWLKAFSPNVADVLFCKALDKDGREQNLPVDSVVRIAESMANIKPKS